MKRFEDLFEELGAKVAADDPTSGKAVRER